MTIDDPRQRIVSCLDAADRMDPDWLAVEVARLMAENARFREGLEIIAGRRQCADNLMSNQDVALAALGDRR